VGVVETMKSFSFESNGIGNVGSLAKWVQGLSLSVSTLSTSEGETSSNGVSEVGFSLSLEASSGASSVVLEGSGERSEEASSFLVGLLEEHAVIVALDLNWGHVLLLLLHGLLLEKGLLLLLDVDGLFNNLHVFGLLLNGLGCGISGTDILGSEALSSVAGLRSLEETSSGGATLHHSGGSLESAGRSLGDIGSFSDDSSV